MLDWSEQRARQEAVSGSPGWVLGRRVPHIVKQPVLNLTIHAT
jgi:hypothetical protein